MGFSAINAALLKEPPPAAWCSGNGIPGCWGMELRPGQVLGHEVGLSVQKASLSPILPACCRCWKGHLWLEDLLLDFFAIPIYKSSCKLGLCYNCK